MLKTELSSFTHAQNAPSRVEETSHKRHQKALTITTFLVIFAGIALKLKKSAQSFKRQSCPGNSLLNTVANNSLRKHPFLLALRRWGRFARRNVCDSATDILYR